ncbi:transposase [Streptomyces sp. AK02-04a]|uniref:transposase n=1 Tax=Streptomyces sp. AK02-04a TaxID=3028649 RepID=UPI0029AA3233|nr:transposase [Streptomyces sp. AK02-04a]MDX3763439.1 transposase [Streptomyces sp. AK02-04a]
MTPPSKDTQGFREEAVQIAMRSSKTVGEVGRELGMNPEALRGWVKKHKALLGPEVAAGLALSERAPLKELERRNRELETEKAFLKKSRSVLREGSPVASKHEFIDEMRLDTVQYVAAVRRGHERPRRRPRCAERQVPALHSRVRGAAVQKPAGCRPTSPRFRNRQTRRRARRIRRGFNPCHSPYR